MNAFIINMINILCKNTNIVFLIFLVSFFNHSPLQAATMVFNSGFETGNLSGFTPHLDGGTVSVPISPVASGKYSGKYQLIRDMSKNTFRAETIFANSKGNFAFNTEYWVSMTFRYEDWVKDSNAEFAPFQVHRRPSTWGAGCGGEVPAYSVAPFLMMTQNDTMKIITYKGVTSWSAPIVKNKWINVVFHFDIGWDENGYVEAWKDGVKLFRRNGKLHEQIDNCGQPFKTSYLNIGIYKWDWKVGRPATQSSRRQLFIDNVRIAQGSNAYSMVSSTSSLTSNISSTSFNSHDPLVVQDDMLVAHWPMTTGSETTTPDESGNGYTAKLANGAQMTGDKSIQFDGIDDYADLGKPQLSGKAMTLSAWIWPNDLENCHPKRGCSLASKATAYGVQAHDLQLSVVKKGSKKRLRFRLNIDGATTTLTAKSGDSIEQGQWIHVAAVFDGNKMRLYQNGGLVGSKTEKGSVTLRNTSSIRLGGHSVDASSYPWSGKIGDVRLYNYALTPEEIAEQAN